MYDSFHVWKNLKHYEAADGTQNLSMHIDVNGSDKEQIKHNNPIAKVKQKIIEEMFVTSYTKKKQRKKPQVILQLTCHIM